MLDKILIAENDAVNEISVDMAGIKTNQNADLTTENYEERPLIGMASSESSMFATQASNVISAKIDFNINYNAGTVLAGQTLLLELPTNSDRKVVFHSSCGDGMSYRMRIFYVENGQINIVEDSQNLLGSFDVDSFITPGGTYYIQIDVLSGRANLHFLVVELAQYSDNEPCDNIYDALALTPAHEIEAADFFDNRMDYDIFAMAVTDDDLVRFGEVYLNFGYTQENLIDPYKKNVRITCMVLLRVGSNLSVVENIVLPASIVDHKISFATTGAGTYYFILAPYDALPVGQLVENFDILPPLNTYGI